MLNKCVVTWYYTTTQIFKYLHRKFMYSLSPGTPVTQAIQLPPTSKKELYLLISHKSTIRLFLMRI